MNNLPEQRLLITFRYAKPLLTAIFLIFVVIAKSQHNNTRVSSMTTFSKLYGYIKYFHPSDECSSINWDKFAVYGAEQVAKCKDQSELLITLNKLFIPIAPTIQIVKTSEQLNFDTTLIIPPNLKLFKVMTWQHLGLGFESKVPSSRNPFKSERLNSGKNDKPLFEKHALPGDLISENIGFGLTCTFPLALYGNEDHTYPKANNKALSELKLELNAEWLDSSSEPRLYTHIGAIIKCWNILRHFYPYQETREIPWEENLEMAISEALEVKDAYGFLRLLRKMTASLNDGHLGINSNLHLDMESHYPPIKWEWIEGKLMITDIFDPQFANIKYHIVEEIEGKHPNAFFKEKEMYISAGNEGSKQNKIEKYYALFGRQNSELNLLLSDAEGNEKSIALKRSLKNLSYIKNVNKINEDGIRKLERSFYYINLMNVEMSDIRKMLRKLKNADGIIFDVRGKPTGESYEVIQYLLPHPDTSKNWMQIPQIIYPNHQKLQGYQSNGWSLTNLKPHIKNKIVFLTDANAVSFAESILSFIKHYRLGTIMGQTTAAANGDVNYFSLPGKYQFVMTGMLVKQHNGDRFIGVEPDIPLEKTIDGIRNGKDDFLVKALQFLRRKN